MNERATMNVGLKRGRGGGQDISIWGDKKEVLKDSGGDRGLDRGFN